MENNWIEFELDGIRFYAPDWKALGSLFAKVSEVTGAMKNIPKNGKHQQGWAYPTWDDISQTVNENLGSAKLAWIVSMPSQPELVEVGTNRNGTPSIRAGAWISFVLGDGDTGAFAHGKWYGHADDTSGGEKAIDKALTYAEKSALKKIFVISAGIDDDPEGASSVYDQEGGLNRGQQPTQKPKQSQKPKQEAKPSGGAMELPENTAVDPNKNSKWFADQVKLIGYKSRDEMVEVIDLFETEKDDEGKAKYNAQTFDALLEDLKSWRELLEDMAPSMEDGKPVEVKTAVNWLKYLGIQQPYTPEKVRSALGSAGEYSKFKAEVLSLVPDFSEAKSLMEKLNVYPWAPGKSDLIVSTIKAHIDSTNLSKKLADEIVEHGATVEDIVANDADDTEEAEEEAEDPFGDFDQMFPPGSMSKQL